MLTLPSILQFFHDYGPILLPVGVWLAGVVVRYIPSNRFGQLQKLAAQAVKSIEQQSNGAYTNEEKYDAAAQGLSLLAARFGYRVTKAEVKLLIEGAVSEFKSLKSSTNAASSLSVVSATAPSSEDSAPQVSPTQPFDAAAGAV